ncbi:murein L,D-transpeptidase [Cesiribacter sp. SM1]|uniref:L,D-transpeptidase family protein n=1 Tax=Cesiribacter sp. SM1 TaxID=2861196 RepID=UPI001CD78CA1|nr:L,D-transpeptidase family protein [Cesiribacter sp. SM1]
MKKIANYLLLLLCVPMFIACNSDGSNRQPNVSGSTSGDEEAGNSFQYSREEAGSFIEQWVDSAELKTNLPKIKEAQVTEDLYSFYSKRNYSPAWTAGTAARLVSTIRNIEQEGLNPDSYPVDTIQTLIEQVQQENSAEAGAKLDLLLSATYLKLADVIATGKVKPGNYYNSWHIKPVAPDTLYTHLQQAVESGEVNASLDYFRPRFDQYEKLQQYIDTYSRIVENGGWPDIESKGELQPGDSSQQVEQIRQRLHISGDLAAGPSEWTSPAVYDSTLISAVNNFQVRMGLEVQPTITAEMIEAMNVPAETRLKQIALNLDRIRWFSSGDMPPTYVLVNLPEYKLQVVDDGEKVKTMKVVVGEQMNSTPIFSDKIQYAVFSPYWNVPNSIAMDEIWPNARNNPGYLSSRHYEVLTGWGDDARVISPSEIDWDNLRQYRIRQKPGPWNSLGRVKFMFPNDYAIYLHDTPADHLFEEYTRAFSHGCIRVEEPAWLADWLFPQYERQDVKNKMNNTNRDIVSLEDEVPVYIFYLTSFVDDNGDINFREDLYELDKRLTPQFDLI